MVAVHLNYFNAFFLMNVQNIAQVCPNINLNTFQLNKSYPILLAKIFIILIINFTGPV